MPKTHCESCNEQRETRVNHVLSKANKSPESELVCELCDYVIATFDGHVMVAEL